MKTNLKRNIQSKQDAHEFLAELIRNGEIWHPDDDVRDITFADIKPTRAELKTLDKLMDLVYDFDSDPCGFIIEYSTDLRGVLASDLKRQLGDWRQDLKIAVILNSGESSDDMKNDISISAKKIEFIGDNEHDGILTLFIHTKQKVTVEPDIRQTEIVGL